METSIPSMAAADIALLGFEPPRVTLTSRARAGEVVELREIPWHLNDKLETLIESDVLPLLEAGLSLDSLKAEDYAAVFAAALPKLKGAKDSVFEIIATLTTETPETLARLRLADVSRLAGACAKLYKDELLAGVATFFSGGQSGAQSALPAESAPGAES